MLLKFLRWLWILCMMQFDTILETCPDLSWDDMIWYDSANMSKLVLKWCNLIQYCKHVKTCPKMIRFDTILQTCIDFLKMMQFDTILQTCLFHIVLNWYEMVQLDRMTKYSKIEQIGNRNLTLTTTTKLF